MKRGLKKKGSSLIAVLVICSIILVTATTMIGVATSDVRMRMNESKKLQNMYKADSGLEVFNNIILKDAEAAIKYAQEEMKYDELIKNSISNASDDEVYERLNANFKANFIKALITGSNVTVKGWPNTQKKYEPYPTIQKLDTQYSAIVASDVKETLANSTEADSNNLRLLVGLKNYRYIKSVSRDASVANGTSIKCIYEDAFEGSEEKPVIKVFNIEYSDVNKTIKFTVRSSFSCSETSTTKLPNKKVVETTFKIVAPEYNDVISRSNSSSEISIPANILTVDGNLDINSDLELHGDSWIKGDASKITDKDPSYAFSKYAGGIKLANDKGLTTKAVGTDFTGNIYTASTLALTNNSKVNLLSGNLYSSNTYIGPSKTSDSTTKDNTLTVNDMITYNDLGINALTSKITINNNYYGINSADDEKSNGKEDSSKKSSCIIINNYSKDSDQSFLKIGRDAYIAGVAYIDTGDNNETGEYKTGESIAVRGNYKVYQEALSEIEKNGVKEEITPTFKYYAPVNLLETVDGKTAATIAQKKDYFNSYYKEKVFKDGNVKIDGNVFSIGAVVSKNKGTSSNGLDLENANLKEARIKYASKVLEMSSQKYDEIADKDATFDTYKSGKVTTTVTGKDSTNAVVNFGTDGISETKIGKSAPYILGLTDKLSNSRYAVVNDESSTLVISKDKIYIKDHVETAGVACDKCVDFVNGGSAVIITNGNVEIEPGVDLTGCIIAGGNVEVKSGSEKVALKYDPVLVGQIIAINKDVFKGWNNTYAINSLIKINANDGDKLSINPDDTNSYNAKDVVANGLWKLIENKDDR